MIKRYEVKEIVDIWSQENKLSTWKKVESSVTKSLEEEGIVPKGLSEKILDAGSDECDDDFYADGNVDKFLGTWACTNPCHLCSESFDLLRISPKASSSVTS